MPLTETPRDLSGNPLHGLLRRQVKNCCEVEEVVLRQEDQEEVRGVPRVCSAARPATDGLASAT